MAKLDFDQERYSQAIELYERAMKLNAADFRMPGGLGIAYKRSGDEAKARAPLEAAIRLVEGELRVNPKRAELYTYKALYLAGLGRKEEVGGLLRRALELAPDNVDIMIRAAETEASVGNDQNAIALLRKIGAKGFPLARLKVSVPLRPLLSRVL